MHGRMLHLPKQKAGHDRSFVVLHGQHHSIERFYSIAQYLNQFGEVYMPDLPGFGGMDSFYAVGKHPSYDAYADYVHSVMQQCQLGRRVWLVGASFGSQVMTRTLQRHPEIQTVVEQAVAIAGLVGKRDFRVSWSFRAKLFPLIYISSTRIGAYISGAIFSNAVTSRLVKRVIRSIKSKYYRDEAKLRLAVAVEARLWRINDRRTHAKTTLMMFGQDLRDYKDKVIGVPLHNVTSEMDQYFSNDSVSSGFRELYKSYEFAYLATNQHSPSIIADKHEVASILPRATIDLISDKK